MTDQQSDEEHENPAWLDIDKDDLHRQEVEPLLFGTGNANLQDPEHEEESTTNHDHDDHESDLETAASTTVSGGAGKQISKNNKSKYGSTDNDDGATTTSGASKSSKSTSASKSGIWPFTGNSERKDKTKPNNKKNNKKKKKNDVVDEEWPGTADTDEVSTRIKYNEISGRPIEPRRSWCLDIFHFIEGYAILTCLCLLASQLLPFILVPIKEMEPVDSILKIYISLFSILFIIVEMDWNIPFVRQSHFLQTYVSRGFLYSFLGLTCLEEAYGERVNEMLAHANDKFHVAWLALFLQVSAWSLCCLGVLYFVMGLFCLKRLRDKLVKQYRIKYKTYKEEMKEFKELHPNV